MNYSTYTLDTCFTITEIITVYHQSFTKDYRFKGEVHNFWEFVYIQEGVVGVTADAYIHDLCSGQAILHQPGEFHSIWNLSNVGSKVFIITFRLDVSLPQLNGMKPILSQHAHYLINFLIAHTTNLKMVFQKDIQKAFLSLPDELPYGYNQVLKNTLELILLDLLQHTAIPTMATSQAADKEPDRFLYKNIISYIHANLLLPLDISTICSHCQVSSSTLKRLFKKFAGISAMGYVNEMKLNYAMKRLDEGIAIHAIADELSFSSQHYFTYFFKHKTGLTPSEYKSKSLKSV